MSPNHARRGAVVHDQHPSAYALALAEAAQAEAEAQAAEALAAAAHARAHALRLRRDVPSQEHGAETVVEGGGAPHRAPPDATAIGADDLDEDEHEPPDGASAVLATSRRGPLRRRPTRRLVAAALAILVACVMLGAGGFLVWQHREASAEQQRTAEFAAAARQGVVTLMSMDFAHAKNDVQRVIDNATGSFKDDFAKQAADFTTTVQQSQVTTVTTVNGTAVKSMTADSANVLVAATSEVTNAAGAKQEPRAWRLAVTVTRDGDQLKLSKVEFVP
jgi:Mce-associated membrane protein